MRIAAVVAARRSAWPYLLVLLLAAIVRVAFAGRPIVHHPDEIWQYIEPSYRMITGRGIVTWEFREGMRGGFIPVLLAGPMWLGRLLAGDRPAYLVPVRILLALASLAIPLAAMGLGRRVSRFHAIVAGLATAASFELVYWSARALSDTIALAFFLPAAWALSAAGSDRRRWAAGGALLALAVGCRFQLAPAAAVLALGHARLDARAWAALAAGGIAGMAVIGLADTALGRPPLGWMATNFRLNLIEHRSADYGVAPAGWYLRNQLAVWGHAAVPLLALALIGARRQPLLLLVAAANLAVHSLIPHKEYRFVLLSAVLLLVLAGIGLADLLLLAKRRWRGPAYGLAALGWLALSLAVARSPGARETFVSGHTMVDVQIAAHRANGCGLAVIGRQDGPAIAYSLYDRPTAVLSFDGPDRLVRARENIRAFDVALMVPPDTRGVSLPGFARSECFGRKRRAGEPAPTPDGCLYRRAGSCRAAADSPYALNRVMERRGY